MRILEKLVDKVLYINYDISNRTTKRAICDSRYSWGGFMEGENNVRTIEEEERKFIMDIINMPMHKKLLLYGIIIGLTMEEQKE